jgi:hypothetical protein
VTRHSQGIRQSCTVIEDVHSNGQHARAPSVLVAEYLAKVKCSSLESARMFF